MWSYQECESYLNEYKANKIGQGLMAKAEKAAYRLGEIN